MAGSEREFDIGVLGGGQLARMSIQAAQRMGLKCVSLDPEGITPASQIAPAIVGALVDPNAIGEIARTAERLTLENEFIPASALECGLSLADRKPSDVIPSLQTLSTVQDKLHQRSAYCKANVPCPKAIPLEGDLDVVEREIGYPMVLKARFGGYDGKGTRYAKNRDELESHRSLWEKGGWLAEEFVDFRRELSVMVFLSPHGDGAFPTMETVQTNHVCDLVFPCDVDASEIAIQAAMAVGEIGIFGIELFETKDGQFLVNEIAPRPHNTGHYTLDWGGVSQFEQHVRIVMGLPPVEPKGGPVCTANLLGQPGANDFRNGIRAALEEPGVRIHWYRKAESRPGRKMGHLNVHGEDAKDRAVQARERFYRAWCA